MPDRPPGQRGRLLKLMLSNKRNLAISVAQKTSTTLQSELAILLKTFVLNGELIYQIVKDQLRVSRLGDPLNLSVSEVFVKC